MGAGKRWEGGGGGAWGSMYTLWCAAGGAEVSFFVFLTVALTSSCSSSFNSLSVSSLPGILQWGGDYCLAGLRWTVAKVEVA